ncbi:MAG: copper resistance protein CopC/CopD [Ardenticatenaceae bacterium]|nr:copper resistance protein CopC/CopD [Ardenticatenaceae bacterium]MCB9443877.1 copper resistance protein CopC/CopD [Ardenticatenaceae bacterium]
MVKKLNFRLIFAVVVVALVTAVTSSISYGHASVVRSDPADNAVLDIPPEKITIWFTEPVAVDFSTFRMIDIQGQTVKLDGIQRDEADHKIITLLLPEIASGVYSIHWNVLSEADGHDTQGVLAFGVGSDADLSAAQTVAADTAVPWMEVLLRWLNFSLLAAVTGALAIRYLILRQSEEDEKIGTAVQEAQSRILTWAIRFAVALFVAGFLLLIYQITNLLETLPDNATFWGTGWKLITLSRWGYLWLARQLMIVLLFAAWRLIQINQQCPEPKLLGLLAAFFTLALTIIQALNSHAAAVETNPGLAVAIDTLHLTSVGLWLGGMLALIIGLLPIIRRDRALFGLLAWAGWGRFGLMAAFSVAFIILTGIYNTGRQVASLDALLTTFYGQSLLSKIGLMLLMGGVGLINSMLLHPRVAAPLAKLLNRSKDWTPLSPRRLPQLVLVEMGLGALVILFVGLVTSAPNPKGPEFMPFDEESVLGTVSEPVDDLLISFSAKPNRPGQNVFLVRAASSRRPEPAEVLRVITRLTYLEEEIGTTTVDAQKIDEGQYHIGGSYFSLPGRWAVEVAVRRQGLEDSVAQFEWVVPPAVGARPVIVSNRPIEGFFSWVALIGLGGLLLVFAGVMVRRRRTAVAHIQLNKTASVSSSEMEAQVAPARTLSAK